MGSVRSVWRIEYADERTAMGKEQFDEHAEVAGRLTRMVTLTEKTGYNASASRAITETAEAVPTASGMTAKDTRTPVPVE